LAIRIVRLGTPRRPGEGLRIGTVRRPPRGVPKKDHARLDYYDVRLPALAPSPPLFTRMRAAAGGSAQAWQRLQVRFERELAKPESARLLSLLAALSRSADFSVGCYCADESRCHRSVLREVLRRHGAVLVDDRP
jgi:uncharacterized protein YeaO (DUF488 family)